MLQSVILVVISARFSGLMDYLASPVSFLPRIFLSSCHDLYIKNKELHDISLQIEICVFLLAVRVSRCFLIH